MKTYRTYKYLAKPTTLQKEMIKKTLSCCTYVYNKYYENGGKEKYKNTMAKDILDEYKRENPYLSDVDTSALMNLLFSLQDNRSNVPKHEKKYMVKSYTTSNLSGKQAIYFLDNENIVIPKLGKIKIVLHRNLPIGVNIIKVIISIDIMGDYYVGIVFSFDAISNNQLNINNALGLDYSSMNLYVDSEGNRCANEHFLQLQEARLNKLKNALSKCRRYSENYFKIKNKIGKLYKKTNNQRKDYLHKLSSKLASKYDVICVEDLDMNEMASHNGLAKNTYDNAYGKFVDQLKYKLSDRGKVLIKIDKYYPSSKRCHNCGYIKKDLKLDERQWLCPKCKMFLDRDINSAINIRNKGVEELLSIGYLD